MDNKKTLCVLGPNGRRHTVKVDANSTILQILENVCAKQGLKVDEYDIKHHNKCLDTSTIIRFSGLPNNAQLELAEAVKTRSEGVITLGVQLENGSRLVGSFTADNTLAHLRLVFVIVSVVLVYLVPTESKETSPKFQIIRRESKAAAEAVGKIQFRDSQCRVQLTAMAIDFVYSVNSATSSLNAVAPNVANNDERKVLADAAQQLCNFVHNLQPYIYESSEKLKWKLSATLDQVNEFAKHLEEDINGSNSHFVNTTLNKAYDFLIYGIYKVKYQAKFFETYNKDLEGEMRTSGNILAKTLSELSPTDKAVEKELRHLMQHLTRLIARNVYNLGTWVEVNSNRHDDVKVVEEIATTLSQLYENGNIVLKQQYNFQSISHQLVHIYGTVIKLSGQAALINYPDNSGGHEFIRSGLFDVIAAGRTYSDNLKAVASHNYQP